MKARGLTLLACVALGGCAENAILELEVALPAAGPSMAGEVESVAFRFDSDTRDFESSWSGQPEHIAVLETEPTDVVLSVIADGPRIRQSLAVRIGYCADRDGCVERLPVSELQYVFERAFYQGHVTRYSIDATSPPSETADTPTDVLRCEVAGCRAGDAAEWCEGGRHFCEL